MDNTRALYILEKKTLDEDDKRFLKIHLETCVELIHIHEAEISYLKDIIDQGKYLDYRISNVRKLLAEIKEGIDQNTIDELLAAIKSING